MMNGRYSNRLKPKTYKNKEKGETSKQEIREKGRRDNPLQPVATLLRLLVWNHVTFGAPKIIEPTRNSHRLSLWAFDFSTPTTQLPPPPLPPPFHSYPVLSLTLYPSISYSSASPLPSRLSRSHGLPFRLVLLPFSPSTPLCFKLHPQHNCALSRCLDWVLPSCS